MNYNHRLILTYLRRQQHPIRKILNISSENIEFPIHYDVTQVDTSIYKKIKTEEQLGFCRHEFDFVYCKNISDVFVNPYLGYRILSNISQRGLIRNISPICLLLKGLKERQIIWTCYDTNSLCFMDYYKPGYLKDMNLGEWDRLCLHKPYYLSDWYTWNLPSEFRTKFIPAEMEFDDYKKILMSAMEQSAKNTKAVIINK
jgi:hypothetical protein